MEQHSRTAQAPIRKVLDASVMLKWVFTDEKDADRALALRDEHLRGESLIIIPSLAVYEFANVIQQPRRRLSSHEIHSFIRQIYDLQLFSVMPQQQQMEQATELARRTGASVYDSIYAVIASLLDCDLITADERAYQV